MARVRAGIGIALLAFNLRTAMAAVSPIAGRVGDAVGMGTSGYTVLAMLPPVCFALGSLAPALVRRAGLRRSVLAATAAVAAGHLLRAVSTGFPGFLAGTVVVLAASGLGNVLLPPLVKRHFPDRVGLVTALFLTGLSLGSMVPPLVAEPLAAGAGWRVSVGSWALPAVVAAALWFPSSPADEGGGTREPSPGPRRRVPSGVVRSPLAWGLAAAAGVSSLNSYTMFAWLPQVLEDTSGASPARAGALLGLYAAVGLPVGLLTPIVATRRHALPALVAIGVGCFAASGLGLLLVPATWTTLWVVLAATGPLLFPLSLVLVSLRSRTEEGATALSGFAQGVGYTIASAGPLVVGLLHASTAGWTAPLAFLLGTAAVLPFAGVALARPRAVEDDVRAATRTSGTAS